MIPSIINKCLYLLVMIAFFTGSGCSIGTEVGNGLKPKPSPDPNKTSNKEDKDDTKKLPSAKSDSNDESPIDSHKSDQGGSKNGGADDPVSPSSSTNESAQGGKSDSKSTAPASSGTQNSATAGVVQQILLNTCASPWGEPKLIKPISMANLATSTGEAQIKFGLKATTVSNQSIFEWGQPATSSYTIESINANEGSMVSVKSTPVTSSALPGATVTCVNITKQSGQLLGPDVGIVLSTSAVLLLDGNSYQLTWYLKESVASQQLVLLRVQFTNQNLIMDFKPY